MSISSHLHEVEAGPVAAHASVPLVKPLAMWRKVLFQVSILAADLVLSAVAILVASRLDSPLHIPTVLDQAALLMLAPCWTGMLFLSGYYTLRPARPVTRWAYQLAGATLLGTGLAIALTSLLSPEALAGRNEYLAASLLAWLFFLIVRIAGRRLGPRAMVAERILVLGADQRAQALVNALCNGHNRQGADLLGAFALDGPPAEGMLCRTYTDLDECARVVEHEDVNHLVIAPSPPLPNDVIQFAAHCDAIGIRVQTMETAYEEFTWRAPIFSVGEAWIASLESVRASKYATRLKRVTDLVCTILLLPLALVIIGVCAVLIKLTSPGPVFYHQERVGRDGVPFTFTKLRTMVVDAEKNTGPVWATASDPRITPIGNFLRKSRLDELPQLFSVLRGHMSLIGPRPERPHFVNQFKHDIPMYEKRLIVRPGITGWAQIHHNYDTCRDDVIEKLRYDLYYIRNLSFALDLQIILSTIGVMLNKKGAH